MKHVMRFLVLTNVVFMNFIGDALAQSAPSSGEDPKAIVQTYSTQMIDIMKGPIAKLLSFIILLACVASLLRGRHAMAISCGIAFIVLLFIQVI